MKKRILSIMLALCMVIMMLPQAVFAETYEDYEYSVSDGKATITSYNGSDEEVTIPDTLGGYPVTAIGMSAFHNKTGIRKIVIPDSVTSIGKNAFYWCSSLESINIPDSVTSIGINAFGSCRNLIEITVDEDNEYYSSVNGVLLDKNKTRLLAFPGGYIGTFDIPDTVTDIENSAFYDCRKLEGVTIPTGVTVIGLQVFMSCYNLKSVTIPSSVKRIGEKAFKNCTSLEYINIPDSVISISDSAFHSCTSLKSIVIPHKVTAISDRTFTFCSSLENVFLSDKVTSIGVSAIPDTTSQIRYSLDETAGKVTITDVSLGSGRTTVEIPSYIDGYPVSAVKASAFDGCDSLERIYLPENISVPDGELPDTATKISYSLDTDKGEATITKIELADGKENVDIPEKIFGYPVAAVAKSEQSKVGAHTCKGGTATCTKKAECAICGKEYGELSDHTFTAETINEDTVKTAGTCTTEAVYYYSCSVCGEVESDDNHTFTGEKDPDNHTGKLKWTQTETQHKQYYDCCDKITVAAEDHDWENGECSKCDYVCTHAGGTPTCTKKAVCEVCGEEYGNLDPDNHTGEQVWVQTATQHEKKWNCCDEITVAAEDHSWENGVCAECDYVCEHSYKWQNEDGKYWKKCSVCGVETAKTDLPELTIDAPDKVCRTQDCEVSVLLPD
ncbi:MAG: leucine-rich repeat domain-containing protein, partial [Oscillospiraceae bacterium]